MPGCLGSGNGAAPFRSVDLVRGTLAGLATLGATLTATTTTGPLLAAPGTSGTPRATRTTTATLFLHLLILRELIRGQDSLDLGRGGCADLGHLRPTLFRGQVCVLAQGTLLVHLVLEDLADLGRLLLGSADLLQPGIALRPPGLPTIRTPATTRTSTRRRSGRRRSGLVAIRPQGGGQGQGRHEGEHGKQTECDVFHNVHGSRRLTHCNGYKGGGFAGSGWLGI